MIVRKLLFRFRCVFVVSWYKLLFGRKFRFESMPSVRSGLQVMISRDGLISIGKGCFFNSYCSLNSRGSIEIGKDCLFGEGVRVYDHNHSFNIYGVPIKEQGYSTGSVVIGDNCWIGSNVTLLKGADIGDNVIVGAGCVVDSKIPSDSIVKNGGELVLDQIQYKRSITPIKSSRLDR